MKPTPKEKVLKKRISSLQCKLDSARKELRLEVSMRQRVRLNSRKKVMRQQWEEEEKLAARAFNLLNNGLSYKDIGARIGKSKGIARRLVMLRRWRLEHPIKWKDLWNHKK